MGKSKYIIFGANNANKGAQAMLYITATEIWQYDSDAEIVAFVGKWNSEEDIHATNIEYVTGGGKAGVLVLSNSLLAKLCCIVKGTWPSKKGGWAGQANEIFEHAKMAIDISGYALGSQWSFGGCLSYLLRLQVAEQYGIPTYVMPQSFGPFLYKTKIEATVLKYCTQRYLGKANLVYSREQEGFRALSEEYHLKNVQLSDDLVLQHSDINVARIFKTTHKDESLHVKPNAVAIIPNVKNYKFGNKPLVLVAYKRMLDTLLALGKNVYIVSHCEEDREICEDIYAEFSSSENVCLVENTYDCINMEKLVAKMDFCIASRYHSIVHSYKCAVPCIALGWASKYQELLKLFGQGKYHFDIRQQTEFEEINVILVEMNNNHVEESAAIKRKLDEIQTKSCFDFLKEYTQQSL